MPAEKEQRSPFIAAESLYQACRLCPRQCGVDRRHAQGFCRAGETPYVTRAALHFWEEPPLVGKGGSGAVFFSGCSLQCDFCQNSEISRHTAGAPCDEERLLRVFDSLYRQGAVNINLVTATHFLPTVARAIRRAKDSGFPLPFVYNTGGYEAVASLRMLDGLIDIYLPDYKYRSPRLAARYSAAEDYPAVAEAAIREMLRQTGRFAVGADGVMTRGTCVRFLLLPGALIDAKAALRAIYGFAENRVMYSLMAQYTPPPTARSPELLSRVKAAEYVSLVKYARSLGIDSAFTQELSSADRAFTPSFDGTGVVE